jgi:lysophospholipase L1-like esterase
MYENSSSPGGYRGPLQAMMRDEKLSFDFVGLDRDGRIADADHNGYSGKTIDWFTRPVNQAIYDRNGGYSHTINSGSKTAVQHFIEKAGMTSDDIILLQVGTNDVRLGDSPTKMLAEIRVLLDQIVNHPASPQVQLVTIPPVGGDIWSADGDPSRTNNDTIRAFNDGLARMVADTYDTRGVTLVNPGVTSAGLSSDGVHMNAAGYEKIASSIFRSLVTEDQVDSAPSPPPVVSPLPPPSGNLLVNGSFEASAVFTGQYASFQSVPGWTAVSGGLIEVWNAHRGVTATDGSDFVELDHAGARDGFYQDVNAAAGQSYTLSFDMRGRPGAPISSQGVEVVWNGQVVATATPGTDWSTFTTTVTGTSGLDRLTIREVGSQGGDGWGALLDDFTLTPKGTAPTAPTGPDTITVKVSGDAWEGDPNFALLVNGRVVDATNLVTADRAEGEWDTLVFRGDFDLDGTDRVGVQFTNDHYEGSSSRDRNLYVDAVTVNGEVNDRAQSLWSAGTAEWDF